MLLCCRDITLEKTGVQEEIGIASDLVRELNDPRFIIPLRLEKFRKLFGIGELQYINFEGRWADGFQELVESLTRQRVPSDPARTEINPNWESYKKRHAVKIQDAPERLTSNWLRVSKIPDAIRYFKPTGAIDHEALKQQCCDFPYPAEVYLRGFFSFCNLDEVNAAYGHMGRFALASEIPVMDFIGNGAESPSIRSGEASNLIVSMFRQAWERYCNERNFLVYFYSNLSGFHVTDEHVPIGKRLPWGRQGEKRSSMLRNTAQGKVWQFGVTALPALWPYPHFKLKSRVLFAELDRDKAGPIFEDKDLQHRFRRRVCKGWRNKQWHGRLMAFLELIADDQAFLKLPLSTNAFVRLDAVPVLFTSPVTTLLPDVMKDEDEEHDPDIQSVPFRNPPLWHGMSRRACITKPSRSPPGSSPMSGPVFAMSGWRSRFCRTILRNTPAVLRRCF
jgi:hypothetical protein